MIAKIEFNFSYKKRMNYSEDYLNAKEE